MNTKPSFSYGIKGKLISAVSMLLVAVIMVVSSTYAWFTLSTAPEVTGISTAIGANGALEIRLNDSVQPNSTNAKWGNIVSFLDENRNQVYGLDKITLLPAEIFTDSVTNKLQTGTPLKYPTYGADGRPGVMDEALTGIFNSTDGKFYPSAGNVTGVQAVGTASGMTARQLAFRTARSAAGSAMTRAVSHIDASLHTEGGTLAGIVVNKALNKNTVSKDELDSLDNLIEGLEAALAEIETAYQQQIIAVAASKTYNTVFTGVTDAEGLYAVVEKAFTDGLKTEDIVDDSYKMDLGNGIEGDLTKIDAIKTGIAEYQAIAAEVATARTNINTLLTSYPNGDAPLEDAGETKGVQSLVLTKIFNWNTEGAVTMNGTDVSGLTSDDLGTIVTSVATGGVNLVLGEGSGVYESLADQVGDFTVKITIEKISFQFGNTPINIENMPAIMNTDSSVINNEVEGVAQNNGTPRLETAATAVEGMLAPESTGGSNMPLTEFYGYILDFEFQTNAANSKLWLQTDPADRIYADNTNPDTQGGGSTMSFTTTTANFSQDQVISLMAAVRVVFFGADGTIYGTARLDTANAEKGEDGKTVDAKLYLYDEAASTTKYYKVTPAANEGENPTKAQVYKYEDGKYYDAATDGTEVTLGTNEYWEEEKINAFIGDQTGEKPEIVALDQNQPLKVSVLVYLDGADLHNSDVAYDAAESATGMLNLQFSSDAKLKPMEYGGLHQPGTNTDNQTPENGEGTENGTT